MIQNTIYNEIEKSDNFKEYAFGVDNDGLPSVFNILRNQLYTDKISAVIREYSCNAYDAHVEAGIAHKPFTVTMPSVFDTFIKIRDFGKGLSEEDIRNIYVYYGKSTKRGSNSMIGMLGIGAKSGFCYTDSFNIVAYVDGTKTSYNAYIDETGIGKIALLNTEKTNEPNGTEICIAVKRNDIQEFLNKSERIFSFFTVKPTIVNAEFTYETENPVLQGTGWKYFGKSGTTYAVMGNVAYEVSHSALFDKMNDEQRRLLNSGMHFFFDIGDLQFSANREGLQYTETTVKAIKAKLALVVKEIKTSTEDRIQNTGTIYEVKKLYGTLRRDSFLRDFYLKKVNGVIQWNGQTISDTEIKCSFLKAKMAIYKKVRKSRSYGDKIIKDTYSNIIDCEREFVVLLNNNCKAVMGRVMQVFEESQETLTHVFVMTLKDSEAIQEFETVTSIQFSSLKKLGDYTVHTTIANRIKNLKNNAVSFFKLDPSAATGHRLVSSLKEYCWTPVDNLKAPTGGVYVQLKSKIPLLTCMDSGQDNYNALRILVEALSTLGVKMPTVYGVKAKQINELDTNNWVGLNEWVKAHFTAMVADKKFLDSYQNYLWIDDVDSDTEELMKIKIARNAKSPFSEFVNNAQDIQSTVKNQGAKFEAVKEVSRAFSLNLMPTKSSTNPIEKEYKDMIANYPMIKCMNSYNIYQYKKEILEYVNLVDKNS